MNKGFTGIELIVMLGLLAVVSAGTWLILNPLELKRRMNDSIRIADMGILQQAITNSLNESTISGKLVLCPNGQPSCKGSTLDSDSNKLKSDGTGWIKADLSAQKSINLPTLPIDPLNEGNYNYSFSSDGKGWELSTVLESNYYKQKMISDGGDNDSKYEVGTNLTLIN